jgi:hypothetical protein
MSSLPTLQRSVIRIFHARILGAVQDLSSLNSGLYEIPVCCSVSCVTHGHNRPGDFRAASSGTTSHRKIQQNSWHFPRDQWAICKGRGFGTEPGDGVSEAESRARETVWTLSNIISLARFASAPLLGWWIVTGQWQLCLPGLALAGLHPEYQATCHGSKLI